VPTQANTILPLSLGLKGRTGGDSGRLAMQGRLGDPLQSLVLDVCLDWSDVLGERAVVS